MIDTATVAKPAHGVIRVTPDGQASIEGFRCDDCGAAFADQTMACRACASRRVPAPFRAVETGRLYSWSVVHRSYPGVDVPFVSAIVDLDDGLTLKGTLRGIEPIKLRQGLKVSVVFDNASGARDKDGNPYVGYHFVPSGDPA